MPERKEKEEVKVTDFTEVFKGLTGLVRENYLSSLQLALSFWGENLKFANAQIEQLLVIQKEYAIQAKAIFERFPGEATNFWSGSYLKAFDGNFDRLAGAQRNYITLVRNVSEKFAKDTANLTQKTAEKTLSVLEEYLSLFKV
jgi:hypothetical protein